MTTHRFAITTIALALAALTVNVQAAVDAAHPDMKATVQRDCENRNTALELLAGTGAFAAAYAEEGDPSPLTVGNETVQVSLDSLAGELKSAALYAPLDVGLFRARVARIAQLDPMHPVAQNWTVVRNVCYTGDMPPAD